MRKVVITTDSGCNPKDMTNMIPDIIVDGKGISYYDMKKVDTSSNLEVINNMDVLDRAMSGEKFHTASPTINDYILVMDNILKQDYDIVHLSMSNGISAGSVNASIIASNMLNNEYDEERISVIDTLTGGSGGTVINDYANDLVKKGLSRKEIVENLEEVKKRLLTSFYISKVEGFVRSGRAPVGASLSDKLSFRYRIDVNSNGRLFPKLPVLRGSIRSQFMRYLKTLINESNIDSYDPNYLTFLSTRLKEINYEEAKQYIESFNYFKNDVSKTDFYSVICAYGEYDQVGIGLIKKR